MTKRNSRGFTLVELMIAMTMLAVVMGGVVSTMTSMQRGYIRQREVARSEDALRVAELTITKILQTAGSNPLNISPLAANPPRLEPYTAPFDTLRVVADFNPVNGVVTDLLEDMEVYALNDTLFVRWQSGGAVAPVAFPVRTLLFQYDSAGTVLNDPVIIRRAATRVRVTLEAPKHRSTNLLSRRDTWVYLRNRR
ncbi:MAG TPA: prepilin-type N-terminal cleavage/methylation domain-containing protein [Gemmatimonadales bacterium]|nr:prepilin-type N-terminal cleavage/methylation domain-containing protein [Gemmatimonadales bacterium]